MDTILTAAEAILRRDPAPALRLPELLDRLRDEGPDARLTGERLRSLLTKHPTRFRLLEVWSGPWRALADDPPRPDLAGECWVAASGPGEPPDGGSMAGRMRETVRWLARRVDARSRRELVRWHRLALAEEAARTALPSSQASPTAA